VAIGILIFLLWDVLTHTWEPIDGALGEHDYGPAAGNGLVFIGCFTVGLLGLVYFERRVVRRAGAGKTRPAGPGAAAVQPVPGSAR
jgi:ZIP family zinc transporter